MPTTPTKTVILPALDLVFEEARQAQQELKTLPSPGRGRHGRQFAISFCIGTTHIAPFDLSPYYLKSTHNLARRAQKYKNPSVTSVNPEKGGSSPDLEPKSESKSAGKAGIQVGQIPAEMTQTPEKEPKKGVKTQDENSEIRVEIGKKRGVQRSEEGGLQAEIGETGVETGVGCARVRWGVLDTPDLVLKFIDSLPADLTRAALDSETFVPGEEARKRQPKKGEPRKGTALDWQAAHIRLISLTVADRDPVVIDLGVDPDLGTPLRQAVEVLLSRLQGVEIVGHRIGFDLAFLEHEFGWSPSKVWDTWVAEELLLNDDWELCSKVLRPKKIFPGPTSLGPTLQRHGAGTLDKELGGGALSDFGMPSLSEEQYAYSAGDTRHLFALADAQRLEMAAAGMTRIVEIEMVLVPILSHMEIVGIPMRADILDQALHEMRRALADLDLEILPAMRTAGFDPALDYSPVSKTYLQPPKKPHPVNVNGANLKQHYFHELEKRLKIKLSRTEKSQQIQFLMSEAGYDGPPITIKEDQISLTTEVLSSIEDPVARLYARRSEISALTVGIEQRRDYIGPDGRVHPVHNQLSANTGRISTEEPPMSNLPKVIKGSPLRRAVDAPPGWVLEQGDLGLIEVRAQAHFVNEPTMIELFNLSPGDPRGDIYRLFASWVEDCPVEQIPAKGPQRNQAKPPVLGTAYLMGIATFIEYAHGYGVELTVPRAAELRALYFRKFPGIKAWHDQAWANAKDNSITEGRSHLGRRRLVLQIPGDDSHQYRQAQAQVNYIIQAACADGLKIAIILIVKALPEGAELILTVHDELLVLCRKEQAPEVSKIVTAAVIAGYKVAFGEPLKVPIVFETNVLNNWSEK